MRLEALFNCVMWALQTFLLVEELQSLQCAVDLCLQFGMQNTQMLS